MGNSVHELRRRNRTTDPPLRIRALLVRVAARRDRVVSPRRQIAGTRDCGFAGEEETAGVVHAGGVGGAVGVWVLF